MNKIAGALIFSLMTAAVAADNCSDKVSFSRQRLFSGYDGKICKIQPSIASDGNGLVLLTWQKLLLTGSDVFCGEQVSRSVDGGKTFLPGKEQKLLADIWEGKIRTARYARICYSKKHRRWFGLGAAQRYENDKVPMRKSVDGKPTLAPLYFDVDPQLGEFTACREIDLPVDTLHSMPFGQWLECENGDLLVPFYFYPPNKGQLVCVIARCTLGADGLKVIAVGNRIVGDEYPRGIGEPSLAKLGDRYYITLRTDVQGLWAESDDGMNFSAPQPWRWDDGSLLENYNTQQHWLRPDGALYLAYTRKGAHNDHVFRHRAPIFMAKFDADRKCLVRSTEVILVPELGARLGNFNVIEYSADESWLITAEWMQSWGNELGICEKYGSDNSLWLAKVKFAIGGKTIPNDKDD